MPQVQHTYRFTASHLFGKHPDVTFALQHGNYFQALELAGSLLDKAQWEIIKAEKVGYTVIAEFPKKGVKP